MPRPGRARALRQTCPMQSPRAPIGSPSAERPGVLRPADEPTSDRGGLPQGTPVGRIEFTAARNQRGTKYTAWLVTCTLCRECYESAVDNPYLWAMSHIQQHHTPRPKFVRVDADGPA